jgi:hypothetical protein
MVYWEMITNQFFRMLPDIVRVFFICLMMFSIFILTFIFTRRSSEKHYSKHHLEDQAKEQIMKMTLKITEQSKLIKMLMADNKELRADRAETFAVITKAGNIWNDLVERSKK